MDIDLESALAEWYNMLIKVRAMPFPAATRAPEA